MLKIIYIYIYIYKRSDNRTFNNTSNMYNNISQYTIYVVNICRINKVSNLKKSYHNFIVGAVINKHNTMHTSGSTNVTKINKLINLNDNGYLQRKYNIPIIELTISQDITLTIMSIM